MSLFIGISYFDITSYTPTRCHILLWHKILAHEQRFLINFLFHISIILEMSFMNREGVPC